MHACRERTTACNGFIICSGVREPWDTGIFGKLFPFSRVIGTYGSYFLLSLLPNIPRSGSQGDQMKTTVMSSYEKIQFETRTHQERSKKKFTSFYCAPS
jgi:hypothetical protein